MKATKKGFHHKHRPTGSKIFKRFSSREQWNKYKVIWDNFWERNKGY